jgi:hypothetical protein
MSQHTRQCYCATYFQALVPPLTPACPDISNAFASCKLHRYVHLGLVLLQTIMTCMGFMMGTAAVHCTHSWCCTLMHQLRMLRAFVAAYYLVGLQSSWVLGSGKGLGAVGAAMCHCSSADAAFMQLSTAVETAESAPGLLPILVSTVPAVLYVQHYQLCDRAVGMVQQLAPMRASPDVLPQKEL